MSRLLDALEVQIDSNVPEGAIYVISPLDRTIPRPQGWEDMTSIEQASWMAARGAIVKIHGLTWENLKKKAPDASV